MIARSAQHRDKNVLVEAALRYAARGWAVLPVWWVDASTPTGCGCYDLRYEPSHACSKPGKHPIGLLVPRGVKDATKDPVTLAEFWRRFPKANVGIACGAVSGFDVLDVDGEEGRATLAALEREHGPLPTTIEAITGSGARHVLFKRVEGLKNAVRFAPGLDIRTDDGLIVAEPSRHVSGGTYAWNLERHPDDTDLTPWPAWLEALVRAAPVAPAPSTGAEGVCIPEGSRNATLASLAGSMRRPGMSGAAIEAALLTENEARCRPPLPESEVRAIAASVAKYAPGPSSTATAVLAVPPGPGATHDREAEVALLACLLKDPVASGAACDAVGGLSASDFYDGGTRQVRLAMFAIQGRGGRPDPVTLRLELEGKDGAGLLAEVLTAASIAALENAEILARRVRKCSEARADRALLDEIRRHLESGAPTAAAAIEAACARRREEFAPQAPLSSAWGWRTPEELAASDEAKTDWIVPNMIARQHVTVVYAKPKVGKTDTVVAGILAPLSRGEGVFGYPAPAGPVLAVILSEETTGRWKSHIEKFGLSGGRILTRGKVPSGVTFAQAVEEAARYAAGIGAAIVVIDTLTAHAGLAGDAENDAGKMGEALDPVLRAAATHNVAFVLIHHVRKWTKDADPADVDLLRGSGNFAAKVDFLVHVTKPSDAPGRFRRRELHVTGRLDCEPYSLLIEKVPGAPDHYRVLNAADADDDPALKDAILEALAEEPMTSKTLAAETERRKADVVAQLKAMLATGGVRCLKKAEKGRLRGTVYALPAFKLTA